MNAKEAKEIIANDKKIVNDLGRVQCACSQCAECRGFLEAVERFKSVVEFCQELRDNMPKKCMCLKRFVGIFSVSVEDGGIQCLDCKLEKALESYRREILGETNA